MASSDAARRLTELHRVTQSKLAAQIVRELAILWRLLDPTDLDRTVERWLTACLAVISARRATSADVAAGYVRAFRALELDTTTQFAPTVMSAIDVEQVTGSLIVNGPGAIRTAVGKGTPVEQAASTALVRVSGAGTRHTLAGSRDTITATIDNDPKARGFQRVTSAKPCAFCAMLASRGPVYLSEASGGFHPHDACHCQPEAVYHRDTAWAPGAREYRQRWGETTKGLSGTDALNAFRRSFA